MNRHLMELKGEHGQAVGDGKALAIAIIVYYPDSDKMVVVGIDRYPKEEIRAILKKFDLNRGEDD